MSLYDICTSKPFLLHIIAYVVTAILVFSSFDSTYALFIAMYPNLQYFAITAYIIGGIFPIVLLIGVIAVYLSKKRHLIKNILYLTVSTFLAFTVTNIYKAITGRLSPECNSFELSHAECIGESTTFAIDSFNFGILENGISWGWPSGHATTATAFGILLALIYWNKPLIRYAGICYTLFISISVSFAGHWLSDAIAGVFIGTSIALVMYSVYKNIQ